MTTDDTDDTPLPASVRSEATRLTRQARRAGDDVAAAAYRRERDALLADHDYTARVREDDDTLVCYPDRWVTDGTVRPDRIEDTDAAVEISLAGDDADWDTVETHNRTIVEQVADEYGPPHGANAAALADFAGNHLGKPIETLTDTEIERFLTDYFPRNAWPDDEQRSAVERSVELAVDVGERRSL
jgi:hypothetical protein